ncbi:hypothetical protein [Rossellomorea sp. NS-SX7]|uniref:hypothetical protein n=1 Tax=Rossellomorea sp. NS-SX7 TaxID=3463856 RepID=UPI004057D791
MKKTTYWKLVIPFALIGMILAYVLPPDKKPYVMIMPLLFWMLDFIMAHKHNNK